MIKVIKFSEEIPSKVKIILLSNKFHSIFYQSICICKNRGSFYIEEHDGKLNLK